MEKLNKDEFFKLVTDLNLKDIQSLCRASKQLNKMICENDAIWLAKLEREHPGYTLSGTPRETYIEHNRYNIRTTKIPPVGSGVKADRATLAKLFGKK